MMPIRSASFPILARGRRVRRGRRLWLYPGRVAVRPHKYTDGHYLEVRPTGPDAPTHLIIFETDGSVVERFRGGRRPQVEYVEGCA